MVQVLFVKGAISASIAKSSTFPPLCKPIVQHWCTVICYVNFNKHHLLLIHHHHHHIYLPLLLTSPTVWLRSFLHHHHHYNNCMTLLKSWNQFITQNFLVKHMTNNTRIIIIAKEIVKERQQTPYKHYKEIQSINTLQLQTIAVIVCWHWWSRTTTTTIIILMKVI